MEAIILAGGTGTRLKSVVSDIPKPMAPVNNKPFLVYLFEYLLDQGITRAILSTGYKHEYIENYFGDSYKGIEIAYSVETEPLGTGGAIKKALELTSENMVYILNGDTFFKVDLNQFAQSHLESKSLLTFSLKMMENFDRYGIVKISQSKVIGFEEKRPCKSGNINGGVYIANTSIFDNLDLPAKFSFENDFLDKYVEVFHFGYYLSDDYFIDIGIPEDYERAQRELKINI